MSDYSQIKENTKTRMEKTLETLRADFGSLRAGRAHASLLDGIMVDAYGSMTPISQVGTISVPDPRCLSVSVWDRGLAKAVEKAIMESDLGLNPASAFRFRRCRKNAARNWSRWPANMPSRARWPSATSAAMLLTALKS